jgi:ParB family chromosome partitioning protein
MLSKRRRKKCLCCKQWFQPDPRSHPRQRYCSEKQLDYKSLKFVKGLIEKRRLIGKQSGGKGPGPKAKTSVESMVRVYRKESLRQKLMIKKATVCDERLAFIVTAFDKLLADENFFTLLRAESLATMPKYLTAKLTPPPKKSA